MSERTEDRAGAPLPTHVASIDGTVMSSEMPTGLPIVSFEAGGAF